MMTVTRASGMLLGLAGVVALAVTAGCHRAQVSTTAHSSPLAPSAGVSGAVLDRSTGKAVNGATITLIPADPVADPGGNLSSRTGDDGSFRIEQVMPGSYTLLVSARGYKDATEKVHFAPRQSRSRQFQLTPLAACPTIIAGRKGPGCP